MGSLDEALAKSGLSQIDLLSPTDGHKTVEYLFQEIA